MKKILLIVPSLNVGGMERMLVNVANCLVRQGNDVCVINMTGGAEEIESLLNSRVRYSSNVAPVKFIFRAKLKDILQLKFRILPLKYWMKFHSSKYIHGKYVKEKFDTEIAFYTGYPVKIVNGCPKETKKIFWLHGEAWQMDGITQGFFFKKNAEKVYKSFDQIVCVSDGIRKDFLHRFGEDCKVIAIPNINDVARIKTMAKEENIGKEGLTFVLVGRVDNQHKGFDRVLTAAKRLLDEGYCFYIWIVGDGIDFNSLKEQKEGLRLNNVKLWGMQGNPYKFINSADVFICSSNYEGYGLVVAEALILEKPVISTNVTGPAEILDNGKYGLVVDNSIDGIYKGMKAVLDDKSLINYYKEKAVCRQDYFSEDRLGKMISDIV